MLLYSLQDLRLIRILSCPSTLLIHCLLFNEIQRLRLVTEILFFSTDNLPGRVGLVRVTWGPYHIYDIGSLALRQTLRLYLKLTHLMGSRRLVIRYHLDLVDGFPSVLMMLLLLRPKAWQRVYHYLREMWLRLSLVLRVRKSSWRYLNWLFISSWSEPI